MPTQQSHHKLNPTFFFLSLGVLVTLITSVSSFLMLAFATLDKQFPDVLNAAYTYGYNSYDYESIRAALATLIIVFPVFLVLSYFWKRTSRAALGSIDITIRKWMIYLVLFLAAVVVVVDLVTLVRYFVSGEITNRFILKVAITLISAIITGSFYILEIKKEHGVKKSAGIAYASIAGALVLALIGYSFSIMGSPAQQRMLRLDERRIGDLQNIQWQVISYWQQKEALPAALGDLNSPLSGYSVPVDPEFQKGMTYEYYATGKDSFKLCATFALPIPHGWTQSSKYPIPMPAYTGRDIAVSSYPAPMGGTNESWSHEAGYACFERTIDKDMYPPFEKQKI